MGGLEDGEQLAWSTSTLVRAGNIQAKDDGKATVIAGYAAGFSVPQENR